MAALGETFPEIEEPLQPQLFIIDVSSQELQPPTEQVLEQQAARAVELIDLIDQAQKALEAFPREAIVQAASTAIAQHHSAIAERGNDDPQTIRLAKIKDNMLNQLSSEERSRAVFDAYDQEYGQAAA